MSCHSRLTCFHVSKVLLKIFKRTITILALHFFQHRKNSHLFLYNFHFLSKYIYLALSYKTHLDHFFNFHPCYVIYIHINQFVSQSTPTHRRGSIFYLIFPFSLIIILSLIYLFILWYIVAFCLILIIIIIYYYILLVILSDFSINYNFWF